MAKTLMPLFFAVSFLLILCDVVTVETCQQTCQTREDCNLSCESGFATCVDGMCVCLADLKTYSAGHTDVVTTETCECREDCQIACDSGIPTCVDGNCVCLILKTYSTNNKDVVTGKIMCKTTLDCRRDLKCKVGFSICVEGVCICSDQLGSILH
ncbi:uncharacterized protein [Nicotiana tomentosiformis]|uniref:Defensin-like protein 298 n=1 Tax=Nicotiana tabacum TaxID=4097 RepID=A0A1S4BHZ6_TOBAC|nr:putative defensin-like protein 298 [Nicotiana tomentosiformis]XP_016488467.1 PREDICTED: putative defensin-like protein 298 [Nicotiana tabacum]